MALARDELKEVLELTYNQLQKKNLLPPTANKENILDSLVNQIESENCELNKQDLDFKRSPDKAHEIQKTLMIAIINESVGQHTAKQEHKIKFDITKLFKDADHDKEKELQQDLKNDLKTFYTAINNKLPKPEQLSAKEIDGKADDISKKLTDNFMRDQKSLSENKNVADVFAEAILTVASLYGGVPEQQITGGIVRQPQAPLMNPEGFVDLITGGVGKSFMAEQNTAEPGKADPSGQKNIMLINVISEGSMCEALDEALQDKGLLMDSKTPRFMPPGSGNY